nr:hypothetical protein [Tanacetum cinerariifolium]
QDDTERGGDNDEESESDEESDGDETREEESFDPIPRTSEDSEDDGNGKEDQGLRISEEERLNKEEEADELYRDVDINQGRGLQLSQDIKDSHMNEAVRVAVQILTDRLRDSYQRENDEFLRTIDENIKRIIKEQVKGQVKEQVSRILPKIEQFVNAQLEAKVLTRWRAISPSSALMKKRNLYKALVETYEDDKIILDTYGETVTLKRRRDDESDKDEGPSAGSDRGSKRRREGKEPESASAPLKTTTRSAGRSTIGSQTRQVSASKSVFAEEPVQTTCQMDEPLYLMFETGADDQLIVQSSQHSDWFSQPKKPPTLDHDRNKTLSAVQGSTQTWISELAKAS